ncbi:bifunctional aminoglycoside phosphotransferase/ATP-binding protein [Noviherbaspirillum agri]
MADQERLLLRQRSLIDAFAATLDGQPVQVFETHISCVVVAEAYAYKFKKPVHFDFVDFSTLDARRHYCEEEMRLNGRLAPDIYLGVVGLYGPPDGPTLEGTGAPIEYAVKMRSFRQQALWSYRLAHGLLEPVEVDRLADAIAGFHRTTAIAFADSPWCTLSALQDIADETMNVVASLSRSEEDRRMAAALQAWEAAQRGRLAAVFAQRKASGAIRECHGDLHSGNILTIDGKVEAFDCIEFNDNLRWIDVMNDIAFACMDLRFLQRPELAARFLNHYLESSGDYAGLQVLHYYEVHRALIRCKVALLRAEQEQGGEAQRCRQQAHAYLDFAQRRAQRSRPSILLMHGFSGCGKSSLSAHLAETLDAVRIRSDVERKRMRGIAATEHPSADTGLYAASAISDTYHRLHDLAGEIVRAGWTVIVDATFLKADERAHFRQLAYELGVPLFIIDVQASEPTLRERIARRQQLEHDASDAGMDVLLRQLGNHDPLAHEELVRVIPVDTEKVRYDESAASIARRIRDFDHTP